MTILNCLGAVVGVSQTVAIAYFFGASRQVEIFFAAVALEVSVVHMTQTGQLTEIFLPVYHRIKNDDGPQQAYACFSVLMNIMLALVVVLAAVMFFLAGWVVQLRVPGFSAADLAVTTMVFQALLPLLVVRVACAMITTLANADKQFGAPEAVSIIGRLVGILVLIALASSWGVWALVVGMYANNLLVLFALVIVVMRFGYRHQLRFHQPGFRPFLVVRRLGSTFVYVVATQFWVFTLDAGLSQLPQGMFAIFKYVQRLFVGKTFGLLLRPLNVVYYTHVSELLTQAATGVRALTRRAMELTLAMWVLLVVGFVAAGTPLLQLLWGGEQFRAEQIDLAGQLACWLLLMLVVVAYGQLFRRIAMALEFVQAYYVACSVVQFMCALICLALLPQSGVYGAFAIVGINMIGLAVVPVVIVRMLRRDLVTFVNPAELGRWAVAGGAGLLAAALFERFGVFTLGPNNPYIAGGVAIAVAGTCVLISVCFAWILGVTEVRQASSGVFKSFRIQTLK